jgi:hypothetical protein
MTSNEFVIWLKGFIQASSNFTLTPKQFDDVKEQLDKVEEDPSKWTRYTLDKSNWNVNTTNKINND